jgi:hypothetical protein
MGRLGDSTFDATAEPGQPVFVQQQGYNSFVITYMACIGIHYMPCCQQSATAYVRVCL